MLKTLWGSSKFTLFQKPSTNDSGAGGNDDLSEDDDDDDAQEAQQLAAEEARMKELKRAGLPEVSVDALHSAMVPKMLTLSLDRIEQLQYYRSVLGNYPFDLQVFIPTYGWIFYMGSYPPSGPLAFIGPRVCLAKRVGKLDEGLKKFSEADPTKLTDLQQRNLNPTLQIHKTC